jgi:hypothetical protein
MNRYSLADFYTNQAAGADEITRWNGRSTVTVEHARNVANAKLLEWERLQRKQKPTRVSPGSKRLQRKQKDSRQRRLF